MKEKQTFAEKHPKINFLIGLMLLIGMVIIAVLLAGVVDWKNKTEDGMDSIERSIDTLNENFVSDKDFKNFVIYKGQKLEADAAYIDSKRLISGCTPENVFRISC